MVLINHRIGAAVIFNDVLHGFRAGQDMGATSLKAKLLHHITAMREEVLYEVFLDLKSLMMRCISRGACKF